MFLIIEEQRRFVYAAKQQALATWLEGEHRDRLPDDNMKRDPSCEMFAIDTSNPTLPTYPIDDIHGLGRKT